MSADTAKARTANRLRPKFAQVGIGGARRRGSRRRLGRDRRQRRRRDRRRCYRRGLARCGARGVAALGAAFGAGASAFGAAIAAGADVGVVTGALAVAPLAPQRRRGDRSWPVPECRQGLRSAGARYRPCSVAPVPLSRDEPRSQDRQAGRTIVARIVVARVRKSAAPRADIRPVGLPPIPEAAAFRALHQDDDDEDRRR